MATGIQSGFDVHGAWRNNLKYLKENARRLSKKYPERFVVINKCRIAKDFASGTEARDYCDTLGPGERESAVVRFVDSPSGVYLA